MSMLAVPQVLGPPDWLFDARLTFGGRHVLWREVVGNAFGLAAAAAVSVAVLPPLLRALGSLEPVWADAWIFTGSLLATFATARGWVDFWLVWLAVDAVDAVDVPLPLRAHLYPSAPLYLVYGGFVVWGFVVWLGVSRRETRQPRAAGVEVSP